MYRRLPDDQSSSSSRGSYFTADDQSSSSSRKSHFSASGNEQDGEQQGFGTAGNDPPVLSLNECYELLVNFDLESFKALRATTIAELQACHEYVKKLRKDLMITRCAAGGSAIVSGLLTAGGLVLIPFTFGASLGLSISGISVGVASAGTAIGGNIVVRHLEKKEVQQAELKSRNLSSECDKLSDTLLQAARAYNNFIHELEELQPEIRRLGLEDGDLASLLAKFASLVDVGFSSAGLIRLVIMEGDEIASTALRVGSKFAIAFAAVGSVLAIGMGTWDIVHAIKTREDCTKAMEAIQNFICELESRCDLLEDHFDDYSRVYAELFDAIRQNA